jgi:dephospho-CoA kinase
VPLVDEPGHVEIVGARYRRVARAVGGGDASSGVLDDHQLPGREGNERPTRRQRVATRSHGGRSAPEQQCDDGARSEQPPPRQRASGVFAGLSHRARVECIGRSTSVHLFGLTGGIASGKTTVAAHLRSRGVPVVDADELAREVVAPGTDGLRAVVEAFGEGVLGPDGALDRKALGRIAFADAGARKRLNALTHPRIAQRTAELAQELARAGEPLVCYEAALLVENGVADKFRPLVVVACPEDVQIARIVRRDGASSQEARARLEAQGSLADKVAAADFVIDTTGPIEHTARLTDDVLRAICAKLGIDAARYRL